MRARLLFLVLAACRPDFGLPVSVVTGPRILAVDAQPPEAKPGDLVHLTAHPVSEQGALGTPVDFAFCTSPKPLTESNVVSSDCLGPDGQVAPIAGAMLETDAQLPLDGCLEFGPDTPASKPGEPPLRPRDADVTGGYYQPVRLVLPPDDEAIALVRIRCNLPNASAQAAVTFAAQYADNTNPLTGPLTLTLDGAPVDALHVPASASVTLHVGWDAAQAERFIVHDPPTDPLVPHREALRVSWFTTAGEIPVVTTGRAEDDDGTDTQTQWQTPAGPAAGTLWAVIRDSRGGSTLQSLTFEIP
jgi:hypothetical protein